MAFQKVIVQGHVGSDPEMRYTSSGVPVTSFSLAYDRNWTDQAGQAHKETTWFRITCWRKQAESAAKWITKGTAILVEGQVKASAWLDKKSGEARASLELTADYWTFSGSKSQDNSGSGTPSANAFDGTPNEDDLPF
jgi:single-strand DNA-binding protein